MTASAPPLIGTHVVRNAFGDLVTPEPVSYYEACRTQEHYQASAFHVGGRPFRVELKSKS